jgi:hypothetical protein
MRVGKANCIWNEYQICIVNVSYARNGFAIYSDSQLAEFSTFSVECVGMLPVHQT